MEKDIRESSKGTHRLSLKERVLIVTFVFASAIAGGEAYYHEAYLSPDWIEVIPEVTTNKTINVT